MRLGIEAGPDTLTLAVELNIKGVPINGGSLVNDTRATLAPLQERDLTPCQIGAFGYNPLAPDPATVARETELLQKIIPLARDTGCRYIMIGPGGYSASPVTQAEPRNFTDAAIAAYAEALKSMVELAEKHDAILTVEPYVKGVIGSAEAFIQLHALIRSDRLRCNIDASSLYAGLHDFLTPMPLVERTIKGLTGNVGLLHLKEIGVEEGFHIKMGLTPIGSGHTDWGRLLALAAPQLPDDSWCIIEHCRSAAEARTAVDFIRNAAHRAGVELS